ncbi:MAG: mevalonate kinase [Candidatus Aenigmarchaeota archaeon]|nr:mevalonate kinase [Candidatus Aenigmarchaeota archaeon]
MVKVSTPGKIYLVGEHAVVYGEPAIIAAIGKRCYVEARKNEKVIITSQELNKSSSFTVDEVVSFTNDMTDLWDKCYNQKDFSELFSEIKKDPLNYAKIAVGKTLSRIEVKSGVSLSIKSDIPVGAGVGSGAALTVTVVKAVSELYRKKLSYEEVNEIAFEIEKLGHGTPSGGDNSTCCYGGLVWFQKKDPKNTIISLKKDIPYKLENFVLVYTKRPEKTTGELVQLVRELEEYYRNKRVKKIGMLACEMLAVLKNRNSSRMKEIINETQKNLAELGVSTPEIDELVSAVKKNGGGAKLCGAGGGGVVLCYHEDNKKLIKTIKDLGYNPIETELGVDGVRIELS